MEHGTGAQRTRTRGVAALARARMARGAGVRLRDAVRAALARLAEPWARVRAAWVAALVRVARRLRIEREARARLDRARRVMRAAGVAWQDPTPVSVDVSRLAWGSGLTGVSSSTDPIYGQAPSGMRFTDEAGPDLRPRRLCSRPVDIAQHHLDTAPTPETYADVARWYRDHLTTDPRRNQR